MGPIETDVQQILDGAMGEVPLSQGGTWGDTLGQVTQVNLSKDDRLLLIQGQIAGLQRAVLRLARELDSR